MLDEYDYLRETSESIIQAAWRDERCPIMNGIVWGSGSMRLFDMEFSYDSNAYKYTILEEVVTDVAVLKEKGELDWTYLIQLAELNRVEEGIRLSCGEAGWGGDGFVAVSRIEDDYLLWMAFFDVSNPFEKINVRENVISGVTNLGNTWRFPIDNPERFSIV